jgi:hypothetical protein
MIWRKSTSAKPRGARSAGGAGASAQGAEVIVARDAKPLAVIEAPQFRGRPIDECIALAKARGSHATPDEDFGKDLELKTC